MSRPFYRLFTAMVLAALCALVWTVGTLAQLPPTAADDLWPNLAEDAEAVSRMATALGEICGRQSGVGLDCGCLAEEFPAARRRKLTQEIRLAERSGSRQRFERALTPEYQTAFDTENEEPTGPGMGAGLSATATRLYSGYALQLSGTCLDSVGLAKDAEASCLGNSTSPLMRIPQGQTPAQYCACVGDHYLGALKAMSPSQLQGFSPSRAGIQLTTRAMVACQK